MSQNTSIYYVGVDFAKLSVEVHLWGKTFKVPNNKEGGAKLQKLLQEKPGAHVICEATGGYERSMVALLQATAIPVTVLNPLRIRQFARAKGLAAKTDALDAKVLTAYGECFRPAASTSTTVSQQRLAALVARRFQVMDLLVIEKNRFDQMAEEVRSLGMQLQRQLQKQIEKIDALIAELIFDDSSLNERVLRLEKIAGVGRISAVGVVAQMPELGQLNRRQAAALSGLAPINRDSGQWEGKRFIGGGRCSVRRVLYMAAAVLLAATPFLNPSTKSCATPANQRRLLSRQ